MTPPILTTERQISDIVLIVDDVPGNLALLHDALDEAGYAVLVATHGDAALQRWAPSSWTSCSSWSARLTS